MKTKNLKQVVNFRGAKPEQIFEMMLSSKLHSQFTGDAAKISRRIGGKFSAYGGYCEGKNLELRPNKKIVQSWRSSEWEAGHFSQIQILLTKTSTGTQLTFTQSGLPSDDYASIKKGWVDFYWAPMKQFLKGASKK